MSTLLATTAAHRDRPAVRVDDCVMTYARLADEAALVAATVHRDGLGPGDRVGLVVPNVPAFVRVISSRGTPADAVHRRLSRRQFAKVEAKPRLSST